VLGALPFIWLVITILMIAFSPPPAIQNHNNPFQNIEIPAQPDAGEK
jgi:hypothetical protein